MKKFSLVIATALCLLVVLASVYIGLKEDARSREINNTTAATTNSNFLDDLTSKKETSKTTTKNTATTTKTTTSKEKETTTKSTTTPKSTTTTKATTTPKATTTTKPDTTKLKNYKNSYESYRYGYNFLTANEKKLYDEIYKNAIDISSIKNGNLTISDISYLSISPTQLEKVLNVFYSTEIGIFYLSRNWEYADTDKIISSVTINYTYTQAQINDCCTKLDGVVNTVLSKMNSSTSEYNKVKIIHDYIINNCVYKDSGDHSYDVYGCLVNKKAVCEGYSKAFSYLCYRAGIETINVMGDSGGPHMWNMVKIDGSWYYMDVTHDDPVSNSGNVLQYNYFNVTSSQIKLTHTVGSDFPYTLPSATATAANYYVKNGLVVGSYNETLALIKKQYNSGVKKIEMKFTTKAIGDSVYKELITNKKLGEYLGSLGYSQKYSYSTEVSKLGNWYITLL